MLGLEKLKFYKLVLKKQNLMTQHCVWFGCWLALTSLKHLLLGLNIDQGRSTQVNQSVWGLW